MDHPQTVSASGTLSVVIATRNRASILSGALLALSQQDLSPSLFEVVVADNGSTDATPIICETFAKVLPNLRLIRDPRPGQIVGWHCGLAVAQGDILAFMDDDVRPRPSWAQAVRDAFADPAVGLATGPIVPLFETPPPDWHKNMLLPFKGGGTWSALWGSIDLGPDPRDISAGFVWGSNFLVRKRALLEARGFHPGGMPAHLFRFAGDGDVAAGRRITANGWRSVYNPQAAVQHLMTAGRNTVAEITRWITGEGLVTSYLLMRNLAEHYPDASPRELVERGIEIMPPERIAEIGRGYLTRTPNLPDDIRAAFETSGATGFHEHQAAFRDDPDFAKWVLRPDYLDLDACYSHPALRPGQA